MSKRVAPTLERMWSLVMRVGTFAGPRTLFRYGSLVLVCATAGCSSTGQSVAKPGPSAQAPSSEPAASTKAESPLVEKQSFESKAQGWLGSIQGPLMLDVPPTTVGFSFREDRKAHVLEVGDYELTIKFSGQLSPKTTASELQKQFSYVVLDKVPVGIEAPPGWTLKLLTPTSSLEDGFVVKSYKDGVLQASLEGRFFALYGKKVGPDCPEIADAPTPERCYFEIRKDLPFKLEITAPLPLGTAP